MVECFKVVRVEGGGYFSVMMEGAAKVEYTIGNQVSSKTPLLVFCKYRYARLFAETIRDHSVEVLRCSCESVFPILYVASTMALSGPDEANMVRLFWRRYKMLERQGGLYSQLIKIKKVNTRLWYAPEGTFGTYSLTPLGKHWECVAM